MTSKAFDNGGCLAARFTSHPEGLLPVQDIFQKAADAIASCNCEEGCIKCTTSVAFVHSRSSQFYPKGIASTACKEKNEVHSKIGALVIIRDILGQLIDVKDIPDQQPSRGHVDSIVVAHPVKAAEGVTVEHMHTREHTHAIEPTQAFEDTDEQKRYEEI